MKEIFFNSLNADGSKERLEALGELMKLYETGSLERPKSCDNVNNHIHTIYSFSPYSPAKAVYLSWESGLATAGIMDHDSVGGAEEFIDAGKTVGFPVTVGFELRCSMSGTPFEGLRLNNPDQKSVAYLAMHGIPHQMIGKAESFIKPYREKRNVRNRKMVDKLNKTISPYGLSLDFDKDILPLSQSALGGSVTERHILYALTAALTENEMARYFLLGVFKSQLVESFYIDADDELPHISEFINLAKEIGAIPAYAYLGDVGVSVTGDKRSQKFEDSYLDELISYLSNIGIRAVTYMPARNSDEQLKRIKFLCSRNNLLQISGEDINSPMQKFICDKIETTEFEHLIDSAWALVGHEIASKDNISDGFFSKKTEQEFPDLSKRTKHFANIARAQYK